MAKILTFEKKQYKPISYSIIPEALYKCLKERSLRWPFVGRQLLIPRQEEVTDGQAAT